MKESGYRPVKVPGESVDPAEIDTAYTQDELHAFAAEAELDQIRDTGEVEIVTGGHPGWDVAVEGPRSAPTGSRFDTATYSYSAGFPDVPPPAWLEEEAKLFLQKRATETLIQIEPAE